MSTVLPNMGLKQPTQGADGAGAWDDDWDDNAEAVDSHDHTTGRGVRVPTAGLNINADLSFASLYAPTNLHRITFASIVALTSNNKSLFVSSADNELYWRSNTGTNVQLTSGNQLNVAAFVGGIGGDYSAVSALLDYDDATDTYRFRQELNTAVRQFAKVKFADIQLVEYDPAGDASVPANAVTIKSPDALAASYSVTMPAAVPGSTSLVQMSSAGVLTASNTVANAVSLGSTLGVTGLITATAGVTAASTLEGTGLNLTSGSNRVRVVAPGGLGGNYDVTLPGALPTSTQVMRMSSAGVVSLSSSQTRVFTATFAVPSSTGGTRQSGASTGGGFINLGTSTGVNWLPVPLSVGEIITAWSVRLNKTSGAGTITARLFEADSVTGAENGIGAAATNGAASPGAIALSIGSLSTTVSANKSYYITLSGGGTTGDSILSYEVAVVP